MTNALLDVPGPVVRPAPERRGVARRHVADVPVVRMLALLVGVSAAIPLGYLVMQGVGARVEPRPGRSPRRSGRAPC